MSRVFEALSKANAARDRQGEKSTYRPTSSLLREVSPAYVNGDGPHCIRGRRKGPKA